jgi:putative DNA primase/helicase
MPIATTPISQATAFLAALFGQCEEGDGHILIWRLSDKMSKWFTDHEKAAKHAVGRPNVYVGVGLRPRALGGNRRGGSEDVIAIPGIWLDLDTEGPGRPSKEEALELLKNIFPQPPTVIIDTGGGYHPWWLFKEIWKIVNAAERRKAIALIKDWQTLVITTAQDRGWKIDNTSDFARVMRIPGTCNDK